MDEKTDDDEKLMTVGILQDEVRDEEGEEEKEEAKVPHNGAFAMDQEIPKMKNNMKMSKLLHFVSGGLHQTDLSQR